MSLLAAGALRVKFYLSEVDRMKLEIGATVDVACDECAAGITGKVSFLASEPQYTSPIIYSREESDQLVFMAEVRLDEGAGILPGQPVTLGLRP